ncbi:MAG: AAA family ATPase [Clostridiaceae bacterium]|nr:AAA family ATPase [Clostridiaceae bacterium]
MPAIVVYCEDFTIVISSSENLGDSISVIEFSAEPWRLLNSLIDRLKKLKQNPTPIVRALVCEGRKKVQCGKPINKGQDLALCMSTEQPVVFIWGPPGTGKTETLAKIALEHIMLKHRVLMLSYSNVSVDGAINRVFKKDIQNSPGKLVRYGYPRDKELLNHEYLTSYNLVLHNHPDLLRERTALIDERKHLSRISTRYVEIGVRLTKIKELLAEEEKRAVKNASFVATTVSKAVVDKTLYESEFDTVIFDEASMAYIPQIVFSAGLAKKHFICMGDFSQLPPIVQSDSSCSLNADIFQYCGIVDAVESGHGHSWLCMLDVQYRMHPDIASFSSKTMYRGLLKSGDNMAKKRKSIVDAPPFAGRALNLVDVSDMMSVCTKTADSSRINVLSAMIAMDIAKVAAQEHEVGIITPYNAQARLLHAMSRDIADCYPKLKKINCATVHQFQGSERDIIIYDAVDCYFMKYPGLLLTSTTNNYANRLYNVALTRAKGKMISITNTDYMEAKGLSKNLIFRRMIDNMLHTENAVRGCKIQKEIELACNDYVKDCKTSFISDISAAKNEIRIDIPGIINCNAQWTKRFASVLVEARQRGVKVYLRTESKEKLPDILRNFAIENKFVANPICLIDKHITWFGQPISGANFVSEGISLLTKYRPIFRFKGKHLANALYGFLEMNRTIDEADTVVNIKESGGYNTFASYVAANIKCSECRSSMKLKKNKKGKFFLSCSSYPKCQNTQFVETDIVDDYFYFNNEDGKYCPQDGTSLEAKMGQYGLYVCCNNGLIRHYFKLDEI